MRSVHVTALALALAAFTAAFVARAHDGQPSPTAIVPVVNVDDMMGLYPQQTVFATTGDHVSGVTVLDHFVRYRIETQGVAEVVADPGARWLYVLDDDAHGARRLRVFDLPGGNERAATDSITDLAPGGHALGSSADGAVLLLKSNSAQAWVTAYRADALQSPGVLMLAPACSDRLLSSPLRIVVVCSSTGEITLGSTSVDSPMPNLIAAAMGLDGAVYLLSADAHLAIIPSGLTNLTTIAWPSSWSGPPMPDGLAVEQSGAYVVLTQSSGDATWLRVMSTSDPTQYRSFPLAGGANGGLVALWPFAYYAFGSSLRHVDLNNGFLEIMAEVGPAATPRAVVNG